MAASINLGIRSNKIMAVNELNTASLHPRSVPTGTFSTFNILGLEKEANEMITRNNAKSIEERMALIIGPKAKQSEIARKMELEKRLNREAVILRKKLITEKKRKMPAIIGSNLGISEQRSQKLAIATCIEIDAGNKFKATSYKAAEQRESIPVIWKLYSVECNVPPFSWQKILQDWRIHLTSNGSSSSSHDGGDLSRNPAARNLFCATVLQELNVEQIQSVEKIVLEEGEIVNDKELSYTDSTDNIVDAADDDDRPTTPPLPAEMSFRPIRSVRKKRKKLKYAITAAEER